ncbi:hypothetical protein HGRIS_001434 [Hohenbuehelia grisea]|uniref:Uncharacterized protein n=1 Tax=Hohenbuehelia grisea TaxID=104357 RepID=A0ABR3JQU2_9AGAR
MQLPAYLISRFLLCKHLVRKANRVLNDSPLTDLALFQNLERNNNTPFYDIPGIHYSRSAVDESEHEVEIEVLGLALAQRVQTPVPPVESLQESNVGEEIGEGELGEPGIAAVQTFEERDNDDDASRAGSGSDEEEEEDGVRVFYSEARRLHLKRCFEEMIETAARPGGVHPKMAKALNRVFDGLDSVGGDISRHKRRRKAQRTWKDSNANTLYLE